MLRYRCSGSEGGGEGGRRVFCEVSMRVQERRGGLWGSCRSRSCRGLDGGGGLCGCCVVRSWRAEWERDVKIWEKVCRVDLPGCWVGSSWARAVKMRSQVVWNWGRSKRINHSRKGVEESGVRGLTGVRWQGSGQFNSRECT